MQLNEYPLWSQNGEYSENPFRKEQERIFEYPGLIQSTREKLKAYLQFMIEYTYVNILSRKRFIGTIHFSPPLSSILLWYHFKLDKHKERKNSFTYSIKNVYV